jgi:MoaA/NifB/PqqE/SkfB family radical SAM enzyme
VQSGCPDESARAESKAFLERLRREGRRRTVPMTGSMALTHRCNLRCVHCYVGPDPCGPESGNEPGTEQWCGWITEAVEAGCLFLLLTGGEPLLRSDFPVIYRHAKESGLLVTVFTNGTLIDEAIAALFRDLPPHAVEMSVYGATAGTHDAITGCKGAFDRTIRATEMLLEQGTMVRLKSVLMALNLHEFHNVRALAETTYGVQFRMDGALIGRLNGDLSPLGLRVAPERVVEHELSAPSTRQEWVKIMQREPQPSAKLYTCAAGVIGFHIDGRGFLSPCLMPTGVEVDLAGQAFQDAWGAVVESMAALRPIAELECTSCKDRGLCGWCPGYARMEKGSASLKSDYLCELGRCRREQLTRDGVRDG